MLKPAQFYTVLVPWYLAKARSDGQHILQSARHLAAHRRTASEGLLNMLGCANPVRGITSLIKHGWHHLPIHRKIKKRSKPPTRWIAGKPMEKTSRNSLMESIGCSHFWNLRLEKSDFRAMFDHQVGGGEDIPALALKVKLCEHALRVDFMNGIQWHTTAHMSKTLKWKKGESSGNGT